MTFQIETMAACDWDEVAKLIFDSTNSWYQKNRGVSIFQCKPHDVRLFCEVYERLDPGCCLIARSALDQRIIGSCFYHPRESHVSLGIMNVHPQACGQGVARALLDVIIQHAEELGLPLRLVSSAMNLDSFSLYTRAGFVPRQLYQDFLLNVPGEGMQGIDPGYQTPPAIRPARIEDVPAMRELEEIVSGIGRSQDYAHFINNELGIWHCSVFDGPDGILGWIASINHPASSMIGPCVAADSGSAIELLRSELEYRRGQQVVFLVPADSTPLVRAAYEMGAKNCELHLLQVRGQFLPLKGISLPTFMPETA
jgi:GNAT superfamily N-acetyltransferase